ncbi:MAG: lysophospholipid acyltransferase family protein [Candidatus Marinimicrobia bacterium]|nr:lysophospholipid acyltransferase family protein [Candidatus Neomarinimicrobiota bacterium]
MTRFLIVLRSLWSTINLFISSLLSALAALVVIPFPFKHSAFNKIVRIWANWNLLVSGIKVEVHGLENIKESSYIIVSNHESALDIFVLFSKIPLNFRMIAKGSLMQIPLVGFVMKKHLFPFVNKKEIKKTITTVNQIFKELREHHLSICIFPEGTRSGNKEILPFKKGAFVLALEHHLPILPVILRGTGDITPTHTLLVRSGKVIVNILPPIETQKCSLEHRDHLVKKTENLFKDFLKNQCYLA